MSIAVGLGGLEGKGGMVMTLIFMLVKMSRSSWRDHEATSRFLEPVADSPFNLSYPNAPPLTFTFFGPVFDFYCLVLLLSRACFGTAPLKA